MRGAEELNNGIISVLLCTNQEKNYIQMHSLHWHINDGVMRTLGSTDISNSVLIGCSS